MGKSPSSCFKIISCGADSTEIDDDLLPPETKQSSDKRRWSFRKRSARDQVSSNTVISEPQVVGFDKENPEATTEKFYPEKDSSVPEKFRVLKQENLIPPLSSGADDPEKKTLFEKTNETTPLHSTVVISEVSPIAGDANETATYSSPAANPEVKVTPDTDKITTDIDPNLQEKAIVVIQTAARRFLAQRKLQKLQKVIKLQAAVRGHLVRKEAIGTLRCVQAIAKMQALVRAHQARQCKLPEKCIGEELNVENFQIDSLKRNTDRSNQTNSTIEKLLCNRFARQLLETTPKTKQIRINCDPSRNDSAWQWLERWMVVTSSNIGQQKELNCPHGYMGEKENSSSANKEPDVTPVGVFISCASEMSPKLKAAKDKQDSEIDNFGNFNSPDPATATEQRFSPSAGVDNEQFQGEEDIGMEEENSTETVTNKLPSETGSHFGHNNYSNFTDSVVQNLKLTAKTAGSDPGETEDKKFDLGSKKMRNPMFAAVQAKFEELSSAPKANRPTSITGEAAVEPKTNQSQVVSVTKKKDLSSTEISTPQNPVIQVAASECGTEISISSTLDSPDRSETEAGEIVLELGTSLKKTVSLNHDAGEELNHKIDETKLYSTTSDKMIGERSKEDEENIANSIAAVDTAKVEGQPAGIITSGGNQQEDLKSQAYRSPEGSPRSQVIAPESQDTPSSQVSTQSKSNRSQKNTSGRKSKSKKGTKSLPSIVKNDSDERSSTEHLLKDAKNTNRRSSSVTAKVDHTDNEPRRSSSNSLPSYMQATESARAKAHGSLSLKSSPDLQDKDNHLKKRHSLPIAEEKQDSSPRVQRSASQTSQTQQSSKRSNAHSPHNAAERRWQR